MSIRRIRSLGYHVLFAGILVLFALVYYGPMLTHLPYGIHSWAQADRYSLALNYFDSGMDFFHPRTSSLYSVDRVTGVEFPIIYYVAAALGHVFGRANIVVCSRVLNIVIVCIGLFCLYAAMFRVTGRFVLSIFTPLFVFSAPVFVSYTGSFLPDPVGVGVFFIGMYYFIRHHSEGKRVFFYWAMLFMLLASLIKSTVVFYYAAVLLYELCYRLQPRQYRLKNVVALVGIGALSVGCVVGWALYTAYLNKQYDANLFLGSTAPFKDWADFGTFLDNGFKNGWVDEYFVLPQYITLMCLLFVGGYVCWVLKKRFLIALTVLFFLALAAGVSFFGHQLYVHDYYMIAIVMPFVAICMLMGIYGVSLLMDEQQAISRRSMAVNSVNIGFFVALLFTFFLADNHVYKRLRLTNNRYVDNSDDWLHSGPAFLTKNRVPPAAPIAIVGSSAPNLALVYFDRVGINFSIGFSGAYYVAYEMKKYHIHYLVGCKAAIRDAEAHYERYNDYQDLIAEDGETVLYKLR